MATCRECGEEYPTARRVLGYLTCLECGELHAKKEISYRRTCVAPAYNKGPLMYIGSKELAACAGKK